MNIIANLRGLLIAALLLLNCGFVNQQPPQYCNARFSFCVQYPPGFEGLGESENGDGQIFRSKDKLAEIRAYGAMVVEDLNETVFDEFQLATRNVSVSYKVVKPDWFIVSGLDKEGDIVYQKTVRKKIAYMGEEQPATDVYQTLMITYPKSQQDKYASYCRVISKSL